MKRTTLHIVTAAVFCCLAAVAVARSTECDSWDGAVGQPGMNNQVRSLAEYGGALHSGGYFSSAGGVSAHAIARWTEANGWQPLGPPGSGVEYDDFTGQVYALAEFNGELIVAGFFNYAGGVPVNEIARWNGSAWQALGSGVTGGPGSSFVYALMVYDGDLIVAGHFTTAGGQFVNNIARWDGSAWHPMGGGLGGSVSSEVRALTVYDGELIAGGRFSNSGGTAVSRIARWDEASSSWQPLGSGLTSGTRAWALTAIGTDLYAAGDFTVAGSVPVSHLARWDGSQWHDVGGGANGSIYALTAYQGDLVVGGDFETVGGAEANNIARWSVGEETWHPLAEGTSGPQPWSPKAVYAMHVRNEILSVGGSFTFAGGEPANRITTWTGCPPSPAIPGDLTGDGSVGVADLLILLSNWGECADCAPGICPADLTGDCTVGVADLLILLANWG